MDKVLLAVHAHPDDETITMGGTLARYSAEGVRTVVVTCTRGDLGEVRDPGLLTDAGSVAELRDRDRQYVSTKLAALACHASQMPADYFLMRMPPELAQRLWAFEYFSRDFPALHTPGEELESDLFPRGDPFGS